LSKGNEDELWNIPKPGHREKNPDPGWADIASNRENGEDLAIYMRIGFVGIDDAADVRSWSGIPFHILKYLREQNVEVELFSPLARDYRRSLILPGVLARIRGKQASLERHSLALRSFASQLSKKLREHSVDVVFTTGSIPITLLECSQPIILWTDAVFHAMLGYYPGGFSNLTSAAVRRSKWQEEEALRRCAIAAYSSTWAAETAKELTDPQKIRLIPFGPNISSPYSAERLTSAVQKKRERGPRSCELLFVGVDWERKGGDIAIETAKLLNHMGIAARLRIVGAKPKQVLPDFVEYLGFIDKNSPDGLRRLSDLYSEADFFILPTHAETAGIVFCEANSFGVPSVSYSTGGVEDYVRNDVNGVCLPPGSPASCFAESIARILSTPDSYQRLSSGAFHEFKTRLNWPNSVSILLELCHEALDKNLAQSRR
jgi:glycosyltransferase involved in cell wall biosynthesis